MVYTLRICFISLFFIVFNTLMAQGELIFDDSYVHEVRVTYDGNIWEKLTSNYIANYPDVPYIMADAMIDGIQIDSIGIRQKGFSSNFGSNGVKKPLKIDFNHYVGGKKYDGLKKINMNNGFGDPAIQRDKLCYNILDKAGVDASRSSYARVYLNDVYWGLYLLVEQVDRIFIKKNFGNNSGNLFKNMGNSALEWLGSDTTSYQQIFELKTDNNDRAWSDFVNFIDILNNSNDDDFKEAIAEVFDVDLYMKVLAVDVATGNWDSYIEHGRNFYLYQDAESEKFNWVPWDYNFALGGTFEPIPIEIDEPDSCVSILIGSSPYPATDSIFQLVIESNSDCCFAGWSNECQGIYDDFLNGESQPLNLHIASFPLDMTDSEKVLISRLLEVPEYKERYYQELCSILEDNITTERLFPLIDQYADLIREDVFADINYTWTEEQFNEDVSQGDNLRGLKEMFENQISYLHNQLDALYECSSTASNLSFLDVSINEFMADNDSLSTIKDAAGETDDWIELYNNTNEDINLSNAYLTDDPDDPEQWQFPVGTTIKADEYLIVWADKDENQQGLHANFKLSKNGDFIMLMEGNDVIDSLTFGIQENNLSYARLPNGTGLHTIQEATFGYNNEDEVTVSVLEDHIGEFRVFPNPASDYINIEFQKIPTTGVKLIITNSIGQRLSSTSITSLSTKIKLDNIDDGLLMVTILDENLKILQTLRLIVLR